MESSLIIRSDERIKEQIAKFDKKLKTLEIFSWISSIGMGVSFVTYVFLRNDFFMLFAILCGISYIENILVFNSLSTHQEIWVNRLENKKILFKLEMFSDMFESRFDIRGEYESRKFNEILDKLNINDVVKYKK